MMLRIDVYRGFGLALVVAGGVSAYLSYLFFGLGPLTAFLIGLIVIGLSILLTPISYPRRSNELINVVNRSLINISYFLETLRISSHNIFSSNGDDVYIYLSRSEISREDIARANNFLNNINGKLIIRLVSPINRELIKDFSEPCPAIDHVIIERFDIGDRIMCIDDRENVFVEIYGAELSSPYRLERVLGGLYGIVIGSITSLFRGDISVEVAEVSKDYIRVVVRRVS